MSIERNTALITGASAGFGLALAKALAQRGWQLIINARDAKRLREAQRALSVHTTVEAISGDVRDEILLLQFTERLSALDWRLDLVVNNASSLGETPLPSLIGAAPEALHRVYHTNVIAPLSLLHHLRPFLSDRPHIINLSSDAAVNAYPGWGVYGASKSALDHSSAVLAAEQPDWNVYAFDPGDMRTAMHQAAFPGEDISDRPTPESIALPAALSLLDTSPPSGRYVADQLIVHPKSPAHVDQ